MPDILNTAVSGLLTYQRTLGTTSHNIANVNTPGYSRQQAELGTRTPDFFGGNFFGTGVGIESITRAYDQFLTSEVRDTNSSFSRANRFGEFLILRDLSLDSPCTSFCKGYPY